MKLLKNKSFVIILAVAAVGIVAKNILLPIYLSARSPSYIKGNGEIKQQKEETIQEIGSVESEYAPVVDHDNIDWAHDYLRDPFIPMTMVVARPVSVEEIDASVVLGEGKLPIQDVLVAVVHDSGKALAVINDVIVGEGDYFDDYKVVKIGLDSVKLEGPNGNKTLGF